MRLAPAVLLVAALLAGCSGSSGVDVSHDWSGVNGYLAVNIDGLVTVVGIDTKDGEARSLAVLPQREDDDPVSGPILARQPRGASLLIRPTTGQQDALYRITRGDEALTKLGGLADGARLFPWAGGWVEVAQHGSGTTVRALELNLSQLFTLQLPIKPDAVATDSANRLCVAENNEANAHLISVDLQLRRTSRVVAFPSTVGVLGCTAQGPLVGVETDPAGAAKEDGEPAVRLAKSRVRTLDVSAGRLDGLLADGATAYAIVATGNELYAVTVNLRTGQTAHPVTLGTLQVADDAFLSGRSLIVSGDDRAAVLDLRRGTARTIRLPGVVFPN